MLINLRINPNRIGSGDGDQCKSNQIVPHQSKSFQSNPSKRFPNECKSLDTHVLCVFLLISLRALKRMPLLTAGPAGRRPRHLACRGHPRGDRQVRLELKEARWARRSGERRQARFDKRQAAFCSAVSPGNLADRDLAGRSPAAHPQPCEALAMKVARTKQALAAPDPQFQRRVARQAT